MPTVDNKSQFSDEQRQNAAVIIRVGQEVGASQRDILIALMTAMQESGLRNLNYGDRDSLGLFQQRTSMAWGSREQILNPEYSARAFYLGAGTNKGLLDYDGRNTMSLSAAAQQVQRSAFPDAYAKHENAARGLLGVLGDGKAVEGTLGAVPGYVADQPTIGEALSETLGQHPSAQGLPDQASPVGEYKNDALGEAANAALGERVNPALDTSAFDTAPQQSQLTSDLQLPSLEDLGVTVPGDAAKGWRADAVKMANQFLGTPYVWGGTSPTGFDCSGLVQYVMAKQGIKLPRLSADQARAGKQISLDELQPGDLVAWDNSSRNNGADHIAIYIGNGKIIEAPRPGASVQINSIYDQGEAWGVRING